MFFFYSCKTIYLQSLICVSSFYSRQTIYLQSLICVPSFYSRQTNYLQSLICVPSFYSLGSTRFMKVARARRQSNLFVVKVFTIQVIIFVCCDVVEFWEMVEHLYFKNGSSYLNNC